MPTISALRPIGSGLKMRVHFRRVARDERLEIHAGEDVGLDVDAWRDFDQFEPLGPQREHAAGNGLGRAVRTIASGDGSRPKCPRRAPVTALRAVPLPREAGRVTTQSVVEGARAYVSRPPKRRGFRPAPQ